MKEQIRILMLEDEPADAELAKNALRQAGWPADIFRVETQDDFIRQLNRDTPDIILSDHGLPSFDGWSALRVAKRLAPEIPFIFVASAMDEKFGIQALRRGASDYVPKENIFLQLGPSIERALREKDEKLRNELGDRHLVHLLKRVTDAFIAVDSKGTYTFLNEKAFQMLGGEKLSDIGKTLWEDCANCFGKHFQENFYKAIEDQQPVQAEEHFPKVQRWFEYRIYPAREGASIFFQDITDRKVAQEAWKKSEARKSTIMDIALDAIISIDHLGMIQEWNPAAERMFGYDREKVLGRELAATIIPERFRSAHRKGLVRSMESSQAPILGRRIEMFALKSDGTEFPVELTATRISMEGLPVYIGFIRDISERKAAEAALQESEQRFRIMADTAPVMIWMANIEGDCYYFNKLWLDFTARDLEEQKGNAWIHSVHPDDRERCLDRYLSAFKIEKSFKTEYRLKRHDGVYRWVLDTGIPRFKEDGTFIGYIGSAIDITDRKETEEALRKSEERFRALVESAEGYAMFMLDPKGRVASWNTGAERIEGYREDEILGKHYSRFFPREDIKSSKPTRALAIASTEGRFQEEAWRIRRDGTRYWASVVISPLRDENGRLYGFSKISRDITERKAAQEVIFRLNAELEERVARRTEQLEAANKELEAFSYSVSHDLRAPLRHIDGFVTILQSTAAQVLDARSKNYLKIISDSAREMSELIDDLLEFSRMGRTELRRNNINFKVLVQDTVEDFKVKLKDRKVEWVIGDIPSIQGDAAMLRQVLVNLISNALKYSKPREVTRIEIDAESGPNETVFHVKDNGVGFDMQYEHKLFGVFQRLHSSKDFEGTGIGLANVRRIIQRHGGRTWAKGMVDKGATFYFSIPEKVAVEI